MMDPADPKDAPSDVAVIGGGAAGMMAVLRAVLNHQTVVWFMGDVDTRRRSRAPWVSEVDNIPGLFGKSHPLPHQQVEVLDWIDAQPALAARLTRFKSSVTRLQQANGLFQLTTLERVRRGSTAPPAEKHCWSRFVVLCTGINDLQPHIGYQPATESSPEVPGSIEPIFPFANANQAIYCVMSDGHRVHGQVTGVIGHTDEAVETLRLLAERYAPPELLLLTHAQPLKLSPQAQALLTHLGTRVLDSPIQGFVGTARPEGLKGVVLLDGSTVPLTRLVVVLGKRLYNALAVQLGAALDETGYVLTDQAGESSVPGLFVAGDLRAGARQQIYSAWDGAVGAIEAIDGRLRALRRG